MRLLFIGLLCIGLCACDRRSVELNEPLRLSPAELSANIKSAEQGDASAAKKVWHHYEFAEGDMEKADKWKATYERLKH